MTVAFFLHRANGFAVSCACPRMMVYPARSSKWRVPLAVLQWDGHGVQPLDSQDAAPNFVRKSASLGKAFNKIADMFKMRKVQVFRDSEAHTLIRSKRYSQGQLLLILLLLKIQGWKSKRAEITKDDCGNGWGDHGFWSYFLWFEAWNLSISECYHILKPPLACGFVPLKIILKHICLFKSGNSGPRVI